MKDLIEKLKKNEKPFGLLTPEEQAMIKDMMCGGHTLKYSGVEWIALDASSCYPANIITYAIKPDYKPEPEVVDLEIVQNTDRADKWLGVYGALLASYDFVELHCLPSLPGFKGFWHKGPNDSNIGGDHLEEIAEMVDEKTKVFARFRA
ncbi:MAG: hypothetical protein IMZ70_01360 [Candidatus Atribacteria bacterium]|nr:hypothetical protein [Candidatus Atribacteria bacterium]MBE3145010.1 hypothetical protein [Planctomycetota bacterium]